MRWTCRHVQSGILGVRYDVRALAITTLNEWRKHYPTQTYKLVRLVTKREKLKRKLESDSDRMESMARGGFDSESMWQRGYARALRDIASQL